MSNEREKNPAALAGLVWQMQAGADEAIEEEPVDRYAESAAAAKSAAAPPSAAPATRAAPAQSGPAAAGPLISNDEVVSGARALAQSAESLEALREALSDFDGCPLKATAMNLCFADGDPQARLMIIGEAPGADEGPSG